jgi:hypothetical protein
MPKFMHIDSGVCEEMCCCISNDSSTQFNSMNMDPELEVYLFEKALLNLLMDPELEVYLFEKILINLLIL